MDDLEARFARTERIAAAFAELRQRRIDRERDHAVRSGYSRRDVEWVVRTVNEAFDELAEVVGRAICDLPVDATVDDGLDFYCAGVDALNAEATTRMRPQQASRIREDVRSEIATALRATWDG